MSQYTAWLDQRWVEWRRINGISAGERVTYAGHKAFDAWLQLWSERNRLDPDRAAAASSAA